MMFTVFNIFKESYSLFFLLLLSVDVVLKVCCTLQCSSHLLVSIKRPQVPLTFTNIYI